MQWLVIDVIGTYQCMGLSVDVDNVHAGAFVLQTNTSAVGA